MMSWGTNKKYKLDHDRRHSSYDDDTPLLEAHEQNLSRTRCPLPLERRSTIESSETHHQLLAQPQLEPQDLTQSSPALCTNVLTRESEQIREEEEDDVPPPIPPRRPKPPPPKNNSRSQTLPRAIHSSTNNEGQVLFQFPPPSSLASFISRFRNDHPHLHSSCPNELDNTTGIDNGDDNTGNGNTSFISFWDYYHRNHGHLNSIISQHDDQPPSYDEAMRMKQLLDSNNIDLPK